MALTSCLSPKTPLMESKNKDFQKRCIWRNVVALVGGVGIFTMGLNPIDDLQCSLNDRDGLGVGSLGIKYALMILGNLFTNTLIIRKLGSKQALVCGSLFYSLYIVANFYPTWSTMIPLTVLAGLGGALMWTTQSHYLATLADNLAQLQAAGSDNAKTLIFGFRGTAIRTFTFLGGLVSSLILSIGQDAPKIYVRFGVCKPEYCSYEDMNFLGALGAHRFLTNITHREADGVANETSLVSVTRNRASTTAVYILCGFCTCSALLGVLLMMACVDPLPKKNIDDSPCNLLLATVRLWKRKEQLFLIPITIACGFQEAFWRVDFNRTPITCALGIEQIVFLLACYNTAMLIGSLLCGTWLGSRRARTIAFPAIAAVDMVSLSAMFLWKFTSSSEMATSRPTTIAYLVTAITGTTYGAITSLLPAFYGIFFPSDLEAAYSNLFFWCFMGSTLMYALSYSLCLRIKLAVVLAMIAIGVVGYVATEMTIQSKLEATGSDVELIENQNSIDSRPMCDKSNKISSSLISLETP